MFHVPASVLRSGVISAEVVGATAMATCEVGGHVADGTVVRNPPERR